MLPISLYIHIPWCVKKCPYCDFNSHQLKQGPDEKLESDYINSLVLDLKQSLENSNLINPKIHSIFIGGGTPSLFSAQSINKLLNNINQLLDIPDNTEITLEANPGTFEAAKFRDFKLAGINRLSIGVQSFDNNCLQRLGRIHDSRQAIIALEHALKLNYNFNIDLMHSLPEQTVGLAVLDLKQAIALEPNHISWYQLTLEPNTKFAKHPPILPNSDILDDIYDNGLDLLNSNSFKQYEISAYARGGLQTNQSVHNLNYWRFGDYLGIGAGAHSKITLNHGKSNKIIRQWKQKSPIRYLNNNLNKISGSTELNKKEVILEYMMNKLRVLEPITQEQLIKHTECNFDDIKPQINQAINHQWLKFQNNNIEITALGRQFLNEIILLFA